MLETEIPSLGNESFPVRELHESKRAMAAWAFLLGLPIHKYNYQYRHSPAVRGKPRHPRTWFFSGTFSFTSANIRNILPDPPSRL